MPLAGPISQGKKFFCPKCGALYSVTRTQAAKKETNIAKCVVCLQVMDETDSTSVSVYKLIHRPLLVPSQMPSGVAWCPTSL